jgi:hypothetical protein
MTLIHDMAAANMDKTLDENNWQDEFLDHETQSEDLANNTVSENHKNETDRKRKIKNYMTVKFTAIMMICFSIAIALKMLVDKEPTAALAIIFAAAGVYLFDAKEPDRD